MHCHKVIKIGISLILLRHNTKNKCICFLFSASKLPSIYVKFTSKRCHFLSLPFAYIFPFVKIRFVRTRIEHNAAHYFTFLLKRKQQQQQSVSSLALLKVLYTCNTTGSDYTYAISLIGKRDASTRHYIRIEFVILFDF